MAYIRFLGEKTPHKATVIPTNNIVTVKFGTDVIENKNGFDLFLDKECTIDIGGTFYQKFTTIYRNDSVTKSTTDINYQTTEVYMSSLKFLLILNLTTLH